MSEFLSTKVFLQMKKKDMVKHTIKFQNKIVDMEKSDITMDLVLERLVSLESDFARLKVLNSDLSDDNAELRKRVYELEDFAEGVEEHLDTLEDEINKSNQYSRRENIEIMNIPPDCHAERLEECVVEVLGKMDVRITKQNIQSCHWLKEDKMKRKNLICRFTTRKISVDCFKNKRKLSGSANSLGFRKDPVIVENLCPAYRRLFDECKLMKSQGLIFKFWVFNGNINIVLTEFSRPFKVFNMNDLYDALDGNW